jgi:hypothetical protein
MSPNDSKEKDRQKAHSDPQGIRAELLRAYRATFTSPAGTLVLDHLRASTGHGKPAFLPPAGGGAIDPYAAAVRDGRKSVIDEILANLAKPEDEQAEAPKAKGRPRAGA